MPAGLWRKFRVVPSRSPASVNMRYDLAAVFMHLVRGRRHQADSLHHAAPPLLPHCSKGPIRCQAYSSNTSNFFSSVSRTATLN
jgi:hypothetical protein